MPIGIRLTLWYSSVLAVSLVVLGGVAWFGIRTSLYHAVDADLLERASGVRRSLEHQLVGGRAGDVAASVREHGGGDAVEIRDDQGTWILRTRLAIERGTDLATLTSGAVPRLSRITISGVPYRSVIGVATADQRTYTFQVIEPLRDIEAALEHFQRWMMLALPIVLVIASAGGYAISGRALAPVDALTSSARMIGASNMSHRVPTPATGDELERLSTTLNDMLQRLELAFEHTRHFTADASHELRTPIAFVRAVAEVLLRHPRTDQEWRAGVQDIHDEAIRASVLIEDLMTLARADARAQPRILCRVDLSRLLEVAVHRAQALGTERSVAVHYEPVPAVALFGDAALLERLFTILLDNAVRYSTNGGVVYVNLFQADVAPIVTVRDEGIGITAEDLPHVFDRFYRSDKARTRETGGSGLGLAIARSIADEHGATITVHSDFGRGSKFSVMFPRVHIRESL